MKIYEFIYVKTKDLVIDSSKQKKYNLLAETMHQPRNDKFSKIKDELIKMHMAGLPVAHISKVLGSPFQVIYKWMKRIGLKPHTSKEHVSNSTVSS